MVTMTGKINNRNVIKINNLFDDDASVRFTNDKNCIRCEFTPLANRFVRLLRFVECAKVGALYFTSIKDNDVNDRTNTTLANRTSR